MTTPKSTPSPTGSSGDLYFRQLPVGPMQNLAYLIGSREAKTCWAVDPAWEVGKIVAAAEADGMRIAGALVTHFHPDHCGGHLWGHDIEGVAELVASQKVRVKAHKAEIEGILKVTGLSRSDVEPLESGDQVVVGGAKIQAIHTPGHTPGSVCFLCSGNLVSGDTLFLSGCGRVDLPGGDGKQLFDSLANKIGKLPESTVIYPGHQYDPDAFASLATVRKMNPYLAAGTLEKWRHLMHEG
jgi:glyoxylase-like metal-dependent hydrolase (beta-lactamase superfamily II)